MPRIAHYATTALFTLMIAAGVVMYLTQYEMAAGSFEALGYPSHLVYLLAGVKSLGLLAIWVRRFPRLTELAYAGFFFELLLAVHAHVMVGDGEWMGAAVALSILVASWATSGARSARDEVAIESTGVPSMS